MKRKFLSIFLVIFLITFSDAEVIAADLTLPNTAINPDKYLFFQVKRLTEKATFFIKFDNEARADYYKELTLRRMAELKYVVENNLVSEVEKSSQRLSYQVGTLSDFINTNKIELEKNKQPIGKLLISYKPILEDLRDKYPANSGFWMLIQHSINSIDLNLEKLK